MRKYIYGLDGIRTVAILGVIFYHLTPFTIPGGFLGVNLFFIIAGYLLTLKLDSLLKTPISLDNYLIESIFKRMLRFSKSQLYMMILTLTAVTILQPKLLQSIMEMFVASYLFLNNMWQIATGASYFERFFGQSVYTHLWYLSVLMQMTIVFSLIYFVIYHVFKNHVTRSIVILLLALLSYVALLVQFNPDNITRIYYGLDTRFFDFLFGSILALMSDDIASTIQLSKWRKQHYVFGSVIAFVFIIASFLMIYDTVNWTYTIWFLIFDCVACYFITVLNSKQSSLFHLFENPIVKYIGSRSFAYYLWYFPIQTIYEAMHSEKNWLSHLTIFMLILLISELFYQLFEQRDVYRMRGIFVFYKQFVRSLKSQHRHFKWINFVKYGILPIAWLIILIVAPKGQNAAANALQQQIAQNESLQAQMESSLSATNDESAQSSETTSVTSSVSTESTQKTGTTTVSKPFTIIGDSVTLSMYSQLKKAFTNSAVNGKVSRQFYHGVDVVNTMKAQNQLKDNVMIMLGTNGPFSRKQVEDLLKAIGSTRHVYFVNIHGNADWQTRMNNLLSTIATENTNVSIIDWHTYSNGKDQWFFSDGYHPNNEGIEIFTKFLVDSVK